MKHRQWRTVAMLCMVMFAIAACSPVQTATGEPSAAITATAVPTMAGATGLPSAQPEATALSGPEATSAGPVALQVLEPQDDAVVSTQQVAVKGTASPGAVVTVNDDILIAGPDGQWQDTVTLDEGLNVIEIIASDTSGGEASVELTVTYEP